MRSHQTEENTLNNEEAETRAKSDAAKLEQLDAVYEKSGRTDQAAYVAISQHMDDMYSAAKLNPTHYVGTLYVHSPDVADRLEQKHTEEQAESRQRSLI